MPNLSSVTGEQAAAFLGNVIPGSTTGSEGCRSRHSVFLQGKMTGISYRVPTADVSVIDVNVVLNDTGPADRAQTEDQRGLRDLLERRSGICG